MKALGFKIVDYKKIEVIELQLNDNGLTQIRGRNEQGKSSILDAVELLLRGPKAGTLGIARKGGSGTVKISGELEAPEGKYKVERIIVGEDHKLKVTKPDGKTIGTKPQAFLDSLINELTFDPRPFVHRNDREKLEFLKDLLGIDTSAIDAKVDNKTGTLYLERLALGRRRDSYGKPDNYPEPEVVDMTALNNEKNRIIEEWKKKAKEVRDFNIANDKLSAEKVRLEKAKQSELNIIKELEKKVVEINEQIKLHIQNTNQIAQEEIKIRNIAPPKQEPEFNTSDVDAKIGSIQTKIKAHKEWEDIQQRIATYESMDKEYKHLGSDIDILRAERTAMIAKVKMPVSGMNIKIGDAWDPDGVYHNGIHSSGWSDSEAMRISAELCIARQPELRCLFIDQGEAYDKESLKTLNKWCEENNIQAMITIVDSNLENREDGAIYIEAGSVV